MPGAQAIGETSILGYWAIGYTQGGWTAYYLPTLCCVSIVTDVTLPASGGVPRQSVTHTVPVSITPSANPAVFEPNPGMVDTLPSKAIRDKTIALQVASGKSAPEAQALWDSDSNRNQMISMLDVAWRRAHP